MSETTELCTFITQWIQCGNSKVLVFYDRGANVNLVREQIALKERLFQTSDKEIKLTVVGGGGCETSKGVYSLILKTTEENTHVELKMRAMKNITTPFARFELDEINKEVRESGTLHRSFQSRLVYILLC